MRFLKEELFSRSISELLVSSPFPQIRNKGHEQHVEALEGL